MTTTNSRFTVDGNDIEAQVEALRRSHPAWYERVDAEKCEKWALDVAAERGAQDDFGPEEAGGRGRAYLRAQAINVEARAVGVAELFRLIRKGSERNRAVVDMLGGDGLVRKVCALLGLDDVDIISCDASPHMVAAAWADNLPALLQRAERPLFQTSSVDAVLLAYGTHHIERGERPNVARNAFEILAPEGVMVLHDFEVGSPVDVWFNQVVHNYSATGHPFDHFTAGEISDYLAGAGFDQREVRRIDDPYVAVGETPEEARSNLGEYLVNMYGLVRLQEELGDRRAFLRAFEMGKDIFRYADDPSASYFTEEQTGPDAWRVTLPRKAIVGVGRKA